MHGWQSEPTAVLRGDWSIGVSICLSICLSVYLYVFGSIYLSIYLSVFLSIYLSVYLPVDLSICLSVYLFICLSIHLPPIYPFVYLFFCLSICLAVSVSVHLCVWQAIFPSVFLSVYLSSDYLFIHLAICLSVHRFIWPSEYLSMYLSIYLYGYLFIYLVKVFVTWSRENVGYQQDNGFEVVESYFNKTLSLRFASKTLVLSSQTLCLNLFKKPLGTEPRFGLGPSCFKAIVFSMSKIRLDTNQLQRIKHSDVPSSIFFWEYPLRYVASRVRRSVFSFIAHLYFFLLTLSLLWSSFFFSSLDSSHLLFFHPPMLSEVWVLNFLR